MKKRIEVKVGSSAEEIDFVTDEHTSIKLAKQRATYAVSAEYAKRCEMAEPFAFAGVYVDGNLVWETGGAL